MAKRKSEFAKLGERIKELGYPVKISTKRFNTVEKRKALIKRLEEKTKKNPSTDTIGTLIIAGLIGYAIGKNR